MPKKKMQKIEQKPSTIDNMETHVVEPHPNDTPGAVIATSLPSIESRDRNRTDTRDNPRAEAIERRSMADRIPMGGMQLKMSLEAYSDQLEGYHPHWFNDEPGRIQRALQAGYEPIYRDHIKSGEGEDRNTDMGTWVSMIVGKHEGTGQPKLAYAMKIRQEWYDEDQKAKLKPVDEVEAAIKRGQITPQQGDASNSYVKHMNMQTNRK